MRIAFDPGNTLIWGAHAFALETPVRRLRARHKCEVRVHSTKHPPQFGTGLLISDAPGVGLEGERHGFAVRVISPSDTGWVAKVKARL